MANRPKDLIVPITGDYLKDAPVIYSFMVYPNSPEKRALYLKHATAQLAFKHSKIERVVCPHGSAIPIQDLVCFPKELYEANQEAETYARANIKELEGVQLKGLIAGEIIRLWATHQAQAAKHGKNATLIAAKNIIVGTAKTQWAVNKQTVDEAWREYKPVAHFWAFETILRHEGIFKTIMEMPPQREALNMLLGYAKGFMEICDSIAPTPQNKGRKSFHANEVYWVSDDSTANMNPFLQTIERIKTSDDLQKQIVAVIAKHRNTYENKKKKRKAQT